MEAGRTPLTTYQSDIWAASRLSPDLPQFNVCGYEQFDGPLDHALLLACVEQAIDLNDALRLRFDEKNGQPYQWVDPEPAAVEVHDFSSAPDPRRACHSWMARAFSRPFDLRRGRLYRLALLRESGSVTYAYLNAHHLVTDGWGARLLLRQVCARYAAAVTGQPSATAGPEQAGAPSVADADATADRARSYLELARKMADYAGSDQRRRDVGHFRAALAGVTPALFPRRATGGYRTGRHSFPLRRELVDRIRATGQSPFTFLAAALAVYLGRVHRADRVVLGVPVLNRSTYAQRQTVGHFANELPVPVAVPGARTMSEVAAELRRTLRASHPHQRLSRGELMREVVPPDGPRQLYDVTLSWLRWPQPLPIPGVTHRTVGASRVHEQDALAVLVNEYDDGTLTVDLDYSLDVFDEDFPVEALGRHLRTLVGNALDRPDEPLARIPMLTDAEHDQVTGAHDGDAVAQPAGVTLHGLFEEQAARTPDRVAVVVDGGGTLSYADLDARANQVAQALRADGVGRDDRVAILAERGPELLAGILGTLKAGGAYVPVDPDNPPARIRYLLADSGAKVLLTSGTRLAPEVLTGASRGRTGTGDRDAVPGPTVRCLDTLGAWPTDPVAPLARATDLAYVIYTSGSTGRPKGVMVEHRSVVNRLAWMQRRYPLDSADVLVQKTPVTFDVSVWELFWWSFAGARLVLPRPGAHRDPRALATTMARHGVTVVHFVPSMLGPFLDLLAGAPDRRRQAGSLRLVFASGEELPARQVDRFHRTFQQPPSTPPAGTGNAGPAAGPRLVNLYGPTEATVDVSYHECHPDPDRPTRRVPIGRPIDNVRLYVLGRDDQPQPVGVPGELCVAGIAVARGYLGHAGATSGAGGADPSARFGVDPVRGVGRMYRTGDLARRLADGSLEYLGRLDGQVKIRGNRVEPGEVRQALAGHPGIREAAVVARASADRGAYLVGYYVADEEIDPVRLRGHLLRRLPDYMVPALFGRLDRLPLTPNGKLDVAALPAPGAEQRPAQEQEPRDDVERTLAEIWSRVLDLPSVGIHQDYHAIGGDSILALRVRAEAERHGLRFTLADLAERPTVAELATLVRHAAPTDQPTVDGPFALVTPLDRARLGDAEDASPATALQLGLLFHSSEHEAATAYHDVFRYSVRMPWHEEAFRVAYERLVARHPGLRSAFDLGGFSEPLQIVHARVAGGLDVADLRALDPAAARAEVLAHMRQRRHHRYAFDRPPLFLFRAHLLPSGVVDLVFSFHHVLLDGWSVATVVGDLFRDYLHLVGAGIEAVVETALPGPAAYAGAERQALASEPDRRFWADRLAGAELTQLDGFRQYEPPGGDESPSHQVPVPAGLEQRVRAFAQAHRLPVKSVYLAAYLLTLRLYSGVTDVTAGLVTHGRPERAGAERTAGLFLNTVPVRLGPGAGSWLAAVRQAHRQEQECQPYRRYPLHAMQQDRGGGPVFELAFNYVHMHVLAPLLDLPTIEPLGFDAWEETNFTLLLNVFVHPAEQRVSLRVDADRRRITRAQSELIADTYLRILARITDQPDAPPDFDFLAGPVLVGPALVGPPTTGQTTAGPPTTGPVTTAGQGTVGARSDVVRRLAGHVRRTPDAVAVAAGDRRWTYARFQHEVNRIAYALVRAWVRPGDLVGVAVGRSPEMIASIYGIARAGAACVPLDVTYPPERIAAMLDQARPVRVVTDRRHAGLVGEPALTLVVEDLGDVAPAPLPTIRPDDLLYVLFTSGSTGVPKGVAMTHAALDNYQEWQVAAVSGAAGGVTLQFAPLSFDVSFQEIYTTISAGGALQIVEERQRRDPSALLRLLDRERVERVFLPYVALQQLAETAVTLGIHPRALRVVISSGEQLRVTAEIRRFVAALPAGAVLENQYGPTETHLVTAYPMAGDPERFPNLPPIGPGIPGVDTYLLDDRLRPVPTGVVGELYFGGVQVARGYHRQPVLTSQRFVPNPFGPPGDRIYRTGDLARVLPNGDLVWLARTDTQAKIRGFRVEPLEAEIAIMKLVAAHPGLREAAVVVRRRDDVDAFLAAFLVGDPDRVDLTALRRRLRETLPEHLVPTRFHWLPQMPLTPSGKRDDRRLRELPLGVEATRPVTPRNRYEHVLAEIIAELLHLPQVGVDHDLFELGATSLTAMRLVTLIEKRYGVAVPVTAFVTAPTVSSLAELLRAGGADPASFDPLVPIRASGDRPPLFLVHPIGGNVLCYLPLARHLPRDQPVYALQAAGVDAGTEPKRSVPELAASYLQAIRRVQPHGPYAIGGWSFGGMVAFEMARQLDHAARQLDPLARGADRLILIDPIARRPGDPAPVADDLLLDWFFWELIPLDQDRPTLEPIPASLTSHQERLDFVARRAGAAGVLRPDESRTAVRRLFEVFRANWEAIVTYRPDVVDLDLTLLRAADPLPSLLRPMHDLAGTQHLDPCNGWAGLTTGRIDVFDVPGDHLALMDPPHVVEVARRITGLLAGSSAPTAGRAGADPVGGGR
ncbi:amino acid adenylation domain-containing protein [Micromonospora sp. WMMD882]|uniref:amino acid adenylation domain-containing protein n=1 Tax=Micromonospora sp. WMMD882 TaxID=3015151 RepID=UPI00248CEB1C|nr:non-ribosomal peptide synthetase [Micromonospora sp. WMMD882]WBB82445.1 amino acid adenylation domain-containing protein [Micromonospora sp. WMMD882]